MTDTLVLLDIATELTKNFGKSPTLDLLLAISFIFYVGWQMYKLRVDNINRKGDKVFYKSELTSIKNELKSLHEENVINGKILNSTVESLKSIKDNLDNDIYSLLYTVQRSFHIELEKITKPEKGLWAYFDECVKDLSDGYHEIKLNGFDVAKLDSFKQKILSDAEFDLMLKYREVKDGEEISYPKSFTRYVDKAQKLLYGDSVDKIERELIGADCEEFSGIIKSNIADSFSRFMKVVIDKFHSTKHMIGMNSDEFDKYITTDEIKELIKEGLLPQAIKLLESYYRNNEIVLDELLLITSNFNRWKKKNRIGIDEKDRNNEFSEKLLDLMVNK